MLIFPAIDMIDGKAVRLYQGDYSQKQTFGDDPVLFAQKFEQQGASYLHLVDLDGAKSGQPANFSIVQSICQKTGLFVELGGGVRNAQTVEQCLRAGVGRVILGTAALRDPEFTKAMVAQYGAKIAVGVDAREGKVAVEGWLDTSDVDSLAFCRKMRDIGVEYIIYTDISKDGAGQGTNLAVYRQLKQIPGLCVTASGGVSSLEDVRALEEIGVYGAIIGKALYTGAIDLSQAIKICDKMEQM